MSQHRKKISELIAQILVIREEIVCEYSPSSYMNGDKETIRDYARLQLSTTLLNKLQILPLAKRP